MTKSLSNILKTSSNILSANAGGTGLTSVGNTGNVLTSTGAGWVSSALPTYTLPTANTTTLGGVKVDGTTITANNGVISSTAYSLPTANTTTLGGVKVDGTTITANNGVISGVPSIPSTVYANGAISLGNSYAVGANSFAVAIANTSASYGATGNNSIAMGMMARATTANSVALGYSAYTTGTYAIAMGYTAVAGGVNSVAFGNSTNAGPNNSAAIGSNSNGQGSLTYSGSGAMALGGSYASGTDSFAAAIGNNTSTYGAQGTNSIAMGYQAKATASNSVAIGKNTSCTLPNCVTLGTGAYTESANRLSFNAQDSYYSQTGIIHLTADTSTGTPTANMDYVIPYWTSSAYTALLVGRDYVSGATAAFKLEGAIVFNGSGSSAPILLGGTNITTLGKSAGASSWDIAVTAVAANTVRFTVTGAATGVKWTLRIDLADVKFW